MEVFSGFNGLSLGLFITPGIICFFASFQTRTPPLHQSIAKNNLVVAPYSTCNDEVIIFCSKVFLLLLQLI
jgi:hypothetical protein